MKIQSKIISVCLVLLSLTIYAQPEQDSTSWDLLSKVKFESKYDKSAGEIVYIPSFSQEVESIEGKRISLCGYFYPLEITGGQTILSRKPYVEHYFCSSGDTYDDPSYYILIDSLPVGNISFDNTTIYCLEGTLIINRTDRYQLLYILENPKIIR